MASISQILIASVLFITLAQAHLHATVGAYQFSIGFAVEPAYTLQANAISASITLNGTGINFDPSSLSCLMRYVGTNANGMPSEILPLEASSDDGEGGGTYVGYFTPSKTATMGYTFLFNGTLPAIPGVVAETAVNLTVSCGQTYSANGIGGAFGCPIDITTTQFPEVVPDAFMLESEAKNLTMLAMNASSIAAKALAMANQALEEHNLGGESAILTSIGFIIAAIMLLRA